MWGFPHKWERDLFIWKEMLLIIGLVMVVISLMFPISYKFKTQYLLIALSVLFGIYMLSISLLVPINDILRELARKFLTLQETQMYVVASMTVIILFIGSWLLSIRIYERKAFKIKRLELRLKPFSYA